MAAVPLLALLSLALPQGPGPSTRSVVRGTVLDGEQRPLAGVAMAVLDGEGVDVLKALARPVARTEQDGTFRLALEVRREPAPWLVIGGPRLATVMVRLDAEDLDLGGFAMAPGTNASGRVRSRGGAAVAGATVMISDLLDTRVFLQEQRSRQRVRCRTQAITDAMGCFRVPGMVQSAGMLQVRKDGFHDLVLQPVALGDPIEVTLTPAAVVTGRVLDVAGAGVGQVQVRLGEASTSTAADGTFTLRPRDPFASEVRALHRIDGRLVTARAFLAAGREVQLQLPAPTPWGSAIRVTALTPARRRAMDFTAYVAWHDQRLPDAVLLAPFGRPDADWTASANGGVATVTGDVSRLRDRATIFVMANGCGLGRVEVRADAIGGEPVVVQLLHEAVVRGRVVDTGGKPVAGAEVIPMQRRGEDLRPALIAGTPTAARTDAEGNYELRCLAPDNHVLVVHAPGRACSQEILLGLQAGAEREGADFIVTDKVTLRGRFDGSLPAGSQVGVQWPGSSMPYAPKEFEGTTSIGPDGAFAIGALPLQDYAVHLFAPAPPRGGLRMHLPAGVWDRGARDQRQDFAAPVPVLVKGKVDGPVPWSRLAVAAMHQDGTRQSAFVVNGPIALVQRDRTYRIVVPPWQCDLLLFDVLTGVPFEWYRVDDAVKGIDFAGRAESLVLRLEPREPEARGAACVIAYLPHAEHWPAGVGNLTTQRLRAGEPRGNMLTDARAGDAVQIWVPARKGALLVLVDHAEVSRLELDTSRAEPVTVHIPAPGGR